MKPSKKRAQRQWRQEQLAEWLKLDSAHMRERQKVQQEYEVVVKCEQFLITHPVFAKVRGKDVQARKAARER